MQQTSPERNLPSQSRLTVKKKHQLGRHPRPPAPETMTAFPCRRGRNQKKTTRNSAAELLVDKKLNSQEHVEREGGVEGCLKGRNTHHTAGGLAKVTAARA
eukprot:COSAG03_NODE_26_length_19032_cov_87.110812_9_plen_101_part_00